MQNSKDKSFLRKIKKSNRSSRPEVFCEKGVLRNFAKFTRKHLCQRFFLKKSTASNLIKKETLAQVFSCDFCEISKNTFVTEHLRWLLLIKQSRWQLIRQLFYKVSFTRYYVIFCLWWLEPVLKFCKILKSFLLLFTFLELIGISEHSAILTPVTIFYQKTPHLQKLKAF